MNKNILGIVLGMAAGIIDVIPMIIQKLTWDANLSAFSMWVVTGFIISAIDLKLNSFLKGILVAFMVLLPTGVLIGWNEPLSLIPVITMTIILGGSLGFLIHKFSGFK